MKFNFLKKLKRKVVSVVILQAIVLNSGIFIVKASELKDVKPKAKCKLEQLMYNAGYTKISHCAANEKTTAVIDIDGEKISCKFDHLPKPERIENIKKRFFAILIDANKGPVDYQFLTSDFRCQLTAPSDADVLAIHIYGQDEKDPDFLLREENFLCKTKFMPGNENVFVGKYYPHVLDKYDSKGKIVVQPEVMKASIFQKSNPNFYAMGDYASSKEGLIFIAVLDLPDGKNDEIKYEDRVFPMCKFTTELEGDDILPSSGYVTDDIGQTVYVEKFYINYTVPEGVDNFFIKIYEADTKVCYESFNEHYLVEQYKVKLKNS